MSGELLKQYQEVIDAADPFLVEAHADKTADELFHMIYELETRLDKVQKLVDNGNHQMIQGIQSSIHTLQAMYHKRVLLDADTQQGLSLV